MIKFSFTSEPIDKIPTELLILLHYEEEVPFHGYLGLVDWRVNGKLSHLVQENKFIGKAKEMVLMPSEKRFQADKLIVMGLGVKRSFEETFVGQVIDYVFQTASQMKASQVCLPLSKLLPSQFEWRNAVRLFVSRLFDYPMIQEVIFCEPQTVIQEAKRRHLEFGPNIEVQFQ